MNLPEILKSKQLSLTKGRIRLLQILFETQFPLSGKDIEERIGGSCDRATIYRNLNVLSSKGIIQRVLSENSVKFKFKTDNPRTKNDHIHFQCESCQKLICMEDLQVIDFPLPEGFSKIENQFLILGICRNCNNER